MENLEIELATKAEQIAEKGVTHKQITDALGVLEEQGLYAFFLYIKANEKGKQCKAFENLRSECLTYLKKLPYQTPPQSSNDQDALEFAKSLAGNLDDLLFARDMLCQCLIYARYHAKAKEEKDKRERKAS